MKKIKFLSLILALSLILVACSNNETTESTNEQSSQTVGKEYSKVEDLRDNNKTFVTINDEEISHEQFYQMYDLYASMMSMNQNLSSELTNLFVIDNIISKELSEANQEVTKDEIDAEVQKYIERLGGQSEYYKYLSVLGTTEDLVRKNIENSLKSTKHKNHYIQNLELTDEELNEYYEQNKNNIDNVVARHILTDDEDTAYQAIERLNNGEDFATVANDLSKDTAANQNGGDLGNVTRQGFDSDFVDAAFELEENTISEPVKTQFGYHVIEVTEKNIGLDKNIDSIKLALGEQKYSLHLQEKVQEANIVFHNADGSEIVTETQNETQVESTTETVNE